MPLRVKDSITLLCRSNGGFILRSRCFSLCFDALSANMSTTSVSTECFKPCKANFRVMLTFKNVGRERWRTGASDKFRK